MSELRNYQKDALAAALSVQNGLLVLPTGSGKSHVIVHLVRACVPLGGKAIILQPTKEILESNLEKVSLAGLDDVAVYSASMDSKRLGQITYATIGSIIKIADRIADCKLLVIDEAHLTNAKEGQYLKFINLLRPQMLIGLTATPYRLHSNSFGSQMKMLTRTRPKIWQDIVHVTQSADLVRDGFLFAPHFQIISGHEELKWLQSNTTGAEYSESSIEYFYTKARIITRIADSAQQAVETGLKHILIFVPTLAQNSQVIEALRSRSISVDYVCSTSAKQDRENKLRSFRSGSLTAMVNVGVLTTGYDFPELDCIILARPTMSLSLYYQMIGRCVRVHPDKKRVVVYDVVNNFAKFDDPLKLQIVKGATGLHCVLSPKGRMTGRFLESGPEIDDLIDFGQHKGKRLADIPIDYLTWYCGACKRTETWHKFDMELQRRKLYA